MIRFVRVYAEGDATPSGLARLAARGLLDMVQLDYVRPRRAHVDATGAAELPEVAAGFVDVVQGLSQSLFLEPELRIVASAGWSNAYLAAEQVAQALAEAGCGDVPVSAVRGSNVLPILDDLVGGKVTLAHADSGAPWSSLRAPIVAADLQLGAGPLATALSEGGRVIVAGCYDSAAPAIAAGVVAGEWAWKDYDRLAGAAAAAHAAVWPLHPGDAWHALGDPAAWPAPPRVEVQPDGAFLVDGARTFQASDKQTLAAWLQAGPPRRAGHDHADVRYDASLAAVTQTGPSQLRASGIAGAPGSNGWRLEVLYQTGFVAEAMLEFQPGAAGAVRRQLADAFRTQFVDAVDERSYVAVQELAPADAGAGDPTWLHLACRSPRLVTCREFADALAAFAAANPRLARLPAGRPTIHAECGVWPTRVPRDAVDIAVDTRPAREWA